jgi:hypothetical protein
LKQFAEKPVLSRPLLAQLIGHMDEADPIGGQTLGGATSLTLGVVRNQDGSVQRITDLSLAQQNLTPIDLARPRTVNDPAQIDYLPLRGFVTHLGNLPTSSSDKSPRCSPWQK